MELALITQFTWTDGLALVTALLGTILYGIIFYVLLIKKKPPIHERIVLFTALTFLFYFSGNFLALFARALAQELFQKSYTIGWVLNLIGLSFMPASLLHAFAIYIDYYLKSTINRKLKNPLRFLYLHFFSIYFTYQFIGNITNNTPLPWPVLTSSITPIQFQFFAWWLGICTGMSGLLSYKLKGNPRWKRFDNYFPINGIFLIIASIFTIIILSQHPWTPELAPAIRLLFLIFAITPGITLGYYLVRYQFLNILIKPTILYSVLTAIVIIIYQFGIRNIAQYLSHFDAINVKMVEIILMVFLVFIFHPIRIYLHQKMNQFFFQDTEKYKSTIHNISQSLKRVSNINQIEKILINQLENPLFIQNLNIISNLKLPDKKMFENEKNTFLHKDLVNETLSKWMESQSFDFVGWIKDQEGSLGVLGIKLKPFKDELNTNELHLLNTILNQLALTMRNIILLEDQVNLEKAILKQEKLSTLGQISASISHEVKNPLHSIYTLIQVMEEDEPKGKELKNDLKTIRNEIEDLTDILNEILLYAHPNKQNAIIKVSVNDVIEKTIRLLSKGAQKVGINIVFNPINSIFIKSNPGKLKEIIFNLILNGIQACHKQGDLIQVEIVEVENDIFINVIDNGPGIKNLNNVFEPYFTTKKEGTGLGLSIVKTKIEELNGSIIAQNRKPNGAEFIINLPKET